ncbi:MAG: hypothetical protein LH615_05800 [Ferruginibacter sp.]|nr:hypothetical protein [Ferruginibacter sp.]
MRSYLFFLSILRLAQEDSKKRTVCAEGVYALLSRLFSAGIFFSTLITKRDQHIAVAALQFYYYKAKNVRTYKVSKCETPLIKKPPL